MQHIHDVTKPLVTYYCIVMSRDPWLLRRCFKLGFGVHRKQPIGEFNWIVISIEIQLIKAANQLAKLITLSVCKYFQTVIFIQIKSRVIKWWRHFPIRSSSSWLSILSHQDGGQKTKSLHREMNFLHVISKQHTLRACYKYVCIWGWAGVIVGVWGWGCRWGRW